MLQMDIVAFYDAIPPAQQHSRTHKHLNFLSILVALCIQSDSVVGQLPYSVFCKRCAVHSIIQLKQATCPTHTELYRPSPFLFHQPVTGSLIQCCGINPAKPPHPLTTND